jgi:hypothetical protein
MADQKWVDQVRELLARAVRRHSDIEQDALEASIGKALASVGDMRREAMKSDIPQIPYPIRRRTLLGQIHMLARHYGLTDEVDAFVAVAGHHVIQSLDNDELEALQGWLARWVDDMQSACDSAYAPPAR